MSDMENMHMTDADQASYDSVSQILKAAIHYVDPTSGRALAILAKSIELNHIMEYLDQDSVAACGVDNNNQVPPGEVLKDLRKYCGPKERAQLDRCLNMINMLSVVQAMANTPSDNEGSPYDMASIMAAFNNMSNASPNKNNQPVNNYTPPPQPQNPAQQEDYMNHLKSMLTPEQLQLFNSIAAGMNQ